MDQRSKMQIIQSFIYYCISLYLFTISHPPYFFFISKLTHISSPPLSSPPIIISLVSHLPSSPPIYSTHLPTASPHTIKSEATPPPYTQPDLPPSLIISTHHSTHHQLADNISHTTRSEVAPPLRLRLIRYTSMSRSKFSPF
uniref:Uncharacterized protein n=1 Tax=Kalanchoe fedtschenkoi TaxID=63787 RepID=A0A7N0UPB4_KALFE